MDDTGEAPDSEHGRRTVNLQKYTSVADAGVHRPTAKTHHPPAPAPTPESLQYSRPAARRGSVRDAARKAAVDTHDTHDRDPLLLRPAAPSASRRPPSARLDTLSPPPTHLRSRRAMSIQRPKPPAVADDRGQDAAAHGSSARARAQRRSASPVSVPMPMPVRARTPGETRGDAVMRMCREFGIPAEKAPVLRRLGLSDERVRRGQWLGKLREDFQKEFAAVMVGNGISELDAFMVLSSGAEARPGTE
ncbi:uncharacterized protein BXZ73DRAFT_99593 [Epithele typhae]|uniref:uncharacterized protein n=1 Tax=Epithele typhae TaxID=378194 RepID=UPI0020089CC8|nr:uncharacterized protein BXZ73DRAFT_99593 [Epithele typhae]KAH9939390.1 hypothetical protein BXZ73DRAFT_99593 [Epithele typhae]